MTTKRALLVSIIIFAGVSLVGAQSPILRPMPVPKHPLRLLRRSVRRKLKPRQRQLPAPKLQLRQRKHADVRKLRLRLRPLPVPKPRRRRRKHADARKPRRRRHQLPAPKPLRRRQKRADAKKLRRRQHQAQARQYQPRQQEVTLARKQARHPPLRRQRPRLQPSRFRSAHSLSRNRQLVRQQPPPPLAPSRLMPHRHQAAVTDWYGLIVTAISIIRKVHVFTAKPSRVNT